MLNDEARRDAGLVHHERSEVNLTLLVVLGLLGVVTRTPHDPRATQVSQQLLLQRAAGLDVERAVDGFVGHLTARLAGIRVPEPAGHLLRRPLPLELDRDVSRQVPMHGQLTGLGTPCSIPCRRIGLRGAVPLRSVITTEFAAHRGRRSTQGGGDGPHRLACGDPARYLFSLAQAECRVDLRRSGGRIPPDKARILCTEEWLRSNNWAICCKDSPRRQRSHISAFWLSL